MRPILAAFVAAITAASLSGCYETKTAVIEKGDRLSSLVGTYNCSTGNGRYDKSHKLTYSEEKEGIWPIAAYRYKDNKGEVVSVKKLTGSLYLAESHSKSGRFEQYYFDVIDNDTYIGLIGDMLTKGQYIEQLAKKNNVQLSSKKEIFILQGEQKNISSFLTSHDKSMLASVVTCKRVAG